MKNKKVKLIIIAAVLIVTVIGIKALSKNFTAGVAAEEDTSKEIEYTVKKDNISISVSESGSIHPTDKRIIKSEINGKVDGIYVTEGSLAEKEQKLISLQSNASDDNITQIGDFQLNIQKTQNELNNLYESQNDLNVYAPIAGVITGLSIEKGKKINADSKIATIKDTDNSYIEVYFIKDDFDKISVGDSASIFMSKYFSTENGAVTEKDSTPVQMGGGTFGYIVTLKINNPGGFSVGDLAQVTITNAFGSYQGMQNGEIIEEKAESITAKVSGNIKSINAENGKYVNKGDIIATIEGDDIELQIKEKQNSIKKYQSQIADIVGGDTIYSPIKGTVLKIDVSEDEVVDRTTALMTVADLDNMEVVISVDELDINKIMVGQQANITCDVYPNEKFTGKVTKISMDGTIQSGVTTFDVAVKLDERKSLMSGMNVDVEIMAERKDNVLTVPIASVHRLNGQYMVTVKDSSGNKTDVKVELGLATKDKTEIISGLKEGDIIVYRIIQSNSSQMPDRMNIMMPAGTGGAGAGGNRSNSDNRFRGNGQ